MNIFSMGVLTDKDKWSLSGTTLTYNAWTLSNGQYDVLPGVVATGAASGSIASADTINANIITANSVTSVRLAGEGGNISNIQTPVISNSTTYARTYSDGHFRVAINNGLKMMIDSDGVEITGALVPAANITYDLGTATRRWKDLYLSNNTIYLNDVSLSADANGLSVAGSTMATETFVTNKITEVVGVAPVALDTLAEIANSLNNDSNFAGTITNSLANKVSVGDFANYQGVVTDALANKVSTTTYTAYVDGMANTVANLVVVDDFVAYQGDVTTALSTKAAITTVDNALANKASITYVDNGLANKASITYVDTGLSSKVDVGDFANYQGVVTDAVANKAAITYVDNELANKASITYVDNGLANKASITYVDNGLANKVSTTTYQTFLDTNSNTIANLATQSFVGNSINALGNIRTVNLDGNVANVLSGNGTWTQNKQAGGNTGEVQFSNGGTLDGSAKFNYDGNTMVVMSESSSVGPASFFRVSNTAGGALNVGRIRGTVANPLPVQVGDQAVVVFPMLTANGTGTIGGITGFTPASAYFGARVTGLPTVDGGLLSQSINFYPTSNVANAARTMMTLEYSNVFIAGNAANSNVTIAGNAANSNVTIAPANDATIKIGGGANTKIIMTTQNVPATATSTGIAGQVAFDSNYIYYCVATDTWKRSPLSTW
jgi:hypothetical protein